MDDSLYDSFRWLDDERDLDLSLDEYSTRIAIAPPHSARERKPSLRRRLSLNSTNLSKPSFQRTRSFNSTNPSPKSTSMISPEGIPISSPNNETPPSLTKITGRRSSSSRPSSNDQFHHASRSSTSSIDPYAQYYQDPEARLKLRVYLASPQKFDEAIEFGFPALNNKETVVLHKGPSPAEQQLQELRGTFLGLDDCLGVSENPRICPNVSRLSYVLEDSRTSEEIAAVHNQRQSEVPQSKPSLGQPQVTREMTLKMTLTRPDLRTDSPTTPSSGTFPAKLAELTPAIQYFQTTKLDADDHGLAKKMWRKFCRRKY